MSAPPSAPSPAVPPVCVAGSLLTLHYRVDIIEEQGLHEVLSTFAGPPATLVVGEGHLALALEKCLLGLAEGTTRAFDLPAAEAFGARQDSLVRRLSRVQFDAALAPGSDPEPGAVLELDVDGGHRCTALLVARDGDCATVDFNHPLAGRAVRFTVQLIGVL